MSVEVLTSYGEHGRQNLEFQKKKIVGGLRNRSEFYEASYRELRNRSELYEASYQANMQQLAIGIIKVTSTSDPFQTITGVSALCTSWKLRRTGGVVC